MPVVTSWSIISWRIPTRQKNRLPFSGPSIAGPVRLASCNSVLFPGVPATPLACREGERRSGASMETAMDYQNILYVKEGPVLTLTLNRPEALNAISPALEQELHVALDEADADTEIRAIILTGAGRAFSAGYDMAPSPERPQSSLDPAGRPHGEYLKSWWDNDTQNVQKLMHLWRLGKPVIAAVNGWAMGGGFWYAMACDITIASEQAVFAQPEVRHISNTTFLFAALAGWKAAHRYALTGDHMDA